MVVALSICVAVYEIYGPELETNFFPGTRSGHMDPD